MGTLISSAVRALLRAARVARLATADSQCRPYLVPVCFALDGRVLYTAVDRKPKRGHTLARVRNIAANPDVALMVDHYEENWERLQYVLVRGTARLLRPAEKQARARALRVLRAKYPQYRPGGARSRGRSLLPADAPIICIMPRRVTLWSARRNKPT
jgi:PPOX class probable F420-dependent enzyme